jgi:hypothetical protein
LGHVFRSDGALAITVMQEGLLRPIGASAPPAADSPTSTT